MFRGDPHTVDPVPFLAPQYSTSEAQISYSDVNRSVEVPAAQNDFSGGIARKIQYTAQTSRQFRYSKGVDTSGPPGTILPPPSVSTIGAVIDTAPTKAVQKGNITYVAAGTKLYQVTDLSTRTLDTTFADSITDLLVWNDKLLVGFGEAGGNYQYRVSDTIAAAFTGGGVKAAYFAFVQNNPIGPVLYRSLDTTPQIAAATDVTATWVSFNIGDNQNAITSLTAHGDHLIVGKTDGPYRFTTDYIAFPIVDRALKLENYITMAKTAISWRGLYIFTGRHSVYVFDGRSVTSVGLDTLADPQVPASAYRPDAFTADPHFLYASVAQSTSPSPISGVYVWKTPDGGRTWHNYLWRSDLGQATSLLFATNKIGSVSKDAIVFAYKSGASWQIAWSPVPSVVDPLKDSAYTFDTSSQAQIRSLDFDGGLATITKHTDRFKLVADSLATAASVDAYAYFDADAALKLATYNKSPFQTVTLRQAKDHLRVSVELRFTSASATAPQQIHGFEFPLRYLSQPVRRHTLHLVATDDTLLASGGTVGPQGSYDARRSTWRGAVDDLRELRRTQTAVDIEDETGRRFTAYLTDIAERTVHRPDGGAPTQVLTTSMLEVVT